MKKNRDNRKENVRIPDFDASGESADSSINILSDLTENTSAISGDDATLEDQITAEAAAPMVQNIRKNDIAPVKLDLAPAKGDTSRAPVTKGTIKSITFLVIASLIVLATVATSLFYNAGINDKLQSPLLIGGKPVGTRFKGRV